MSASLVVADAGLVLSSASPYRPGQDVVDGRGRRWVRRVIRRLISARLRWMSWVPPAPPSSWAIPPAAGWPSRSHSACETSAAGRPTGWCSLLRGWTSRWGIRLLRHRARDPLLAAEPRRFAGTLWADDLDLADPLVSPVNGRMAGLPRTTVFIGGPGRSSRGNSWLPRSRHGRRCRGCSHTSRPAPS